MLIRSFMRWEVYYIELKAFDIIGIPSIDFR